MTPGLTALRRWSMRLLLTLAGLQLLYLLVANVLLQTEVVKQRLEQATAKSSLRWTSAWSWFPGQLHLTDMQLDIHTPRRRLGLVADEASARLDLAALIECEWRLTSLEATGIREVSLGDQRVRGLGQLSIEGLRWQRGELAIEQIDLTVASAMLNSGETRVAQDVSLDARLTLAPMRPAEQRGRDFASFVSGRLDIAGTGNAAGLFERFLAEQSWLKVVGHGNLDSRFEIERGSLVAGSELRLASSSLALVLDEAMLLPGGQRYRLDGSGEITARVTDDSDQTQLAVALEAMRMQRLGDDEPILEGNGFRLALATDTPELDAPPPALRRASLRWRDTEMADIAVLNRYLSLPVSLELEAGRAAFSGELHYHDDRVRGTFDLAGDEVALRLAKERLAGELALHLAIPDYRPDSGQLDLSGTQLELLAHSRDDNERPFNTVLAFPRARLDSLNQTPDADLRLVGHVANLGFLDPFLDELFGGRGLQLEGGGELDAALRIKQGQLLPGTRLNIRSQELGSRFLDFHARGRGRVRATVQEGETHPEARVAMTFDDVALQRPSDGRRLLQAERLTLDAVGEAPSLGSPIPRPHLDIQWRDANVSDVSVLNRYMPGNAPFRLETGQAHSDGRLTLVERRLAGRVGLVGDTIAGYLFGERLQGGLDLDLRVREADLSGRPTDFSGTRLDLQASGNNHDDALRTRLVARQARLGRDDGRLLLDATIANLGFLNTFLPDEHGLEVGGDGRLSADFRLAGGRLAPGSDLYVSSERLGVRFLDHEAMGDGTFELTLDGDVEAPRAELLFTLPRFGIRRRDETGEYLQGRLFSLHARASHFDIGEGFRDLDTHIKLPSAEVPDLATFNAYLPEGAGIELLGGHARLSTELRLQSTTADGKVSLNAQRARLRLKEQVLVGDLSLDTLLASSDLEALTFDVSGSSLRLDNTEIDAAGHSTTGWWAKLILTDGRLTWRRPLALEAHVDLALRDSGLLVNLYVDAARERRWLRNLLTIRDVEGSGRVVMDDHSIALHDATLRAGNSELLADLQLRDGQPQGRLLARYGLLRLGVDLGGEGTEWRWWRPQRWYERGTPIDPSAPDTSLPFRWRDAVDTRP